MRRTREPELTGPDYLVGIAATAADQGRPFAREFRDMIAQAFIDSRLPLLAEATAKRPLKEHEAAPAAISLGAVQTALERGDRQSAQEALQVGVSLLAKWPAWLLSRIDGHPDFVWKPVDESDPESGGCEHDFAG